MGECVNRVAAAESLGSCFVLVKAIKQVCPLGGSEVVACQFVFVGIFWGIL